MVARAASTCEKRKKGQGEGARMRWRERRWEKGSYGSEDATKDEAQAVDVDVSVLVRVVFHGGWVGRSCATEGRMGSW
jgi:hypothetical protein